jgi:hypothetical protein
VLAGDRAAELDAQFEDLGPEAVGALPFTGLVRIEQDQGMQVSIAGMKDVHAAQPMLLFHPLDGREHAGQSLAGNRAVHAVVVRRDAAGGRKRILAA